MINKNVIAYKGCQVVILAALKGDVNACLGVTFDIRFADGTYRKFRGIPNRFDSQHEAIEKAKKIINGDIEYN